MGMTNARRRIVLAKVGLDGHDRGIKVVARGLRDRGFHVIYAGLWQSPEAVVRAVADEDADWLGLSLLSGAHMTLVPRVLELLRQAGLGDVGVLVGGIIPERGRAEADSAWRGAGVRSGHGDRRDRRFLRAQGTRQRCNRRRRRSLTARRSERAQPAADAGGAAAEAIATMRERTRQPSPARKRPRVIAVTGSGGVGKSTLIGKLIEVIRAAGRSVAVLACDPQSPLTGGASARRSHPHAEPARRRCRVHPKSGHAERSFGRRAERRSHDRSVRPFRIRHRHCRDRRGRTRRHGDPRRRRCRHRPRAARDRRRAAMGKGRPARNRRHRRGPQGRSARRGAIESQLRELLNLPGCRPVPVVRVSSSKGIGFDELWADVDATTRTAMIAYIHDDQATNLNQRPNKAAFRTPRPMHARTRRKCRRNSL